MANFIHKISKTLALMLIAYTGQACAQVTVPVDGQIGVFKYSTQMPRTWVSTSLTFDKAQQILSKDQVQLKPVFAYEGPKGNLVFGTWKELKPGVAFTAAQLSSDAPQFPDDWGVLTSSLSAFTGATDSGIEYSGFSILGAGDGKNFGKGKPIRTFGVWFDLPISYKDSNGLHSGLASIYYRSNESESTNASAGVKFVQNLISKLQLAPGVVKISAEQYKLSVGKNDNQASQVVNADSNLSATHASAAPKKEASFSEYKFNPPLAVGILYNEKGVMFCYNYGAITQAPCSLAQPGTNKAEVNPAVINQLNAVASRKSN